ncbi:unnamed protein product [Adineta steineri]|uniref:Uncharacterized protein n=1 Tax=Adineta steineri TaxID=433720 RepID=A0A815AUV7_9BILA|nr:unnamed protein product [Adineta steineri]CAF4273990.1 unnamed protein product [Adineta steineri]
MTSSDKIDSFLSAQDYYDGAIQNLHFANDVQVYDNNIEQQMDMNEKEVTAAMADDLINLEAEQADRVKVEAITAAICQYSTSTKASDR